ncbi:MAG: hypothetical protein RL204_918 [Bacteroidota bacterium]|jgi:hypothetical protein
MFTAALATISSLSVIVLGKYNVPLGTVVVIYALFLHFVVIQYIVITHNLQPQRWAIS